MGYLIWVQKRKMGYLISKTIIPNIRTFDILQGRYLGSKNRTKIDFSKSTSKTPRTHVVLNLDALNTIWIKFRTNVAKCITKFSNLTPKVLDFSDFQRRVLKSAKNRLSKATPNAPRTIARHALCLLFQIRLPHKYTFKITLEK